MSKLGRQSLLGDKQEEEELKQWDISHLPSKATSLNLFNELSQFKVNNHDECLVAIIEEWDDTKIVRVTPDDVRNLLKKREYITGSMSEYEDNDIYAKLWELAVQIRKINFIMHRQKMVYIPPPVQKEYDRWGERERRGTVDLQKLDPRDYILNQLNQKEQSDEKLLTKSCEGCHKTIENVYKDNILCYNAKINEEKYFYFHDDYCVTLRILKDVIRRFALEDGSTDQTKYWSTSVMKLIEKPEDAMNLDQPLPKPLENVLKEQDHSRIIMSYKRAHAEQMKKLIKHLNNNDCEYKNLPLEIKYSNLNIYGKSLLTFIIYQLLEQKTDSLLLILKYILSQLSIVFAINIVNEARNRPWSKTNVDNLDDVLTIIINTSTYTVATALYWSAMMKAEAAHDFTRAEEFKAISNKYIEMALQIVDAAESDHILSLLLETPSNIHQKNSHNQSALDIALKHNIEGFLNNSRVQHLFSHMWSEYNYLDPAFESFRSKDISMRELEVNLIKNPAKFYYCPVGRYIIESFTYILYVLIVTFVTFQHHDLTGDLFPMERIMWSFNFGYIVGELQQIIAYRTEYLTDIGNAFDVMIIMNWILLAIIRFGCKNVLFECEGHDAHTSLVFMFMFCIQICVLWSRIALLFRTSLIIGPLIAMIPKMVEDIFVWIFVLSIFFIGFSFGANYIISGDITEECADDSLGSFSLVFEYVFLLLMGQSDWSVLDRNDCISNARSILLKIVMWIFSMMGTILLLNLLIAMMASTYDNLRQEPAQVVNVAKSKIIYVFATHLTIMPAPFNLLIYAAGILWIIFELIIFVHSKGTKMINITKLIPVKIHYFDKNKKENTSNEINEFLMDRSDYSLQNESIFKLDIFDQRRIYCRFCRFEINTVFIVKYPFQETIFDESLKPPNGTDNVNTKQKEKDCGNCPKCYRPFESEDRLPRRQVILEIISFYVFIITLYIPLIIILGTVTLLAEIGEKYNKFADTTADKLEEPQVTTAVYYDDYIHRIEKTLNINGQQQDKQENVENLFKKLNERLDSIEKKMNIDGNQEEESKKQENKENEEEVKQEIDNKGININIPKWGQQLKSDLVKLQKKIKSVDSMTDEHEEQIQIKQKELRYLKKQQSLAELTMNNEAKDFAEIQQETKENELENDIAILETQKSNLTKQIKQYKAKHDKDIDALKQMGQNVDDFVSDT